MSGVTARGAEGVGAELLRVPAVMSREAVTGVRVRRRVCSYFRCIDNFPDGHGYMVECDDRKFSMSGGIDGACSDNGGVAETAYRG